jgi:outer membrane immunogenic protein
MKKVLLAASAFVAMTGVASAHDWSGPYVGGAIGTADRDTAWIDDDNDWVGTNVLAHDGGEEAVTFSAFGGYNWQVHNFVFGGQLDLTFGDLKQTDYFCPGGCAPDEIRLSDDLTWMLAARANVGYAVGRFLPYATVGYAWSDMTSSWYEDGDLPDSWPEVENEDAIVYGLGGQFAVNDKIALGVEALRYDFGDETEFNNAGTTFRMTVGTEVDVVRFTGTYGF